VTAELHQLRKRPCFPEFTVSLNLQECSLSIYWTATIGLRNICLIIFYNRQKTPKLLEAASVGGLFPLHVRQLSSSHRFHSATRSGLMSVRTSASYSFSCHFFQP
jgi:hypothetical protein